MLRWEFEVKIMVSAWCHLRRGYWGGLSVNPLLADFLRDDSMICHFEGAKRLRNPPRMLVPQIHKRSTSSLFLPARVISVVPAFSLNIPRCQTPKNCVKKLSTETLEKIKQNPPGTNSNNDNFEANPDRSCMPLTVCPSCDWRGEAIPGRKHCNRKLYNHP